LGGSWWALRLATARVVTNWHVVKSAASSSLPIVHLRGGDSPAVIVGVDVENDLAILQLLQGIEALVPPRRSEQPIVGERVFSIGSPKQLANSLAEGLVSNIQQHRGRVWIQTTAAISPGSSGGGLFDESGRLVGITVAGIEGGQQLNFAVPTRVVELLLATGLFGQATVAQSTSLLRPDAYAAFASGLSKPEAERLRALSAGAQREPISVTPPAPRPEGVVPTEGGAAPRREGSLNLRASDTADVFLDGKKAGGSPLLGIKVKAGKHQIRFDCYDATGNAKPGIVQTVDVAADGEKDVEFECLSAE
jgi:S1-C subfamily serine protease